MATAESTRSVVLSHLAKSAKKFGALKDVKYFVCKWCPTLEVEVLAALLLHMTRCSILIIFPGLWVSIGVTCSYSSRPFLCTLDGHPMQKYLWICTSLKWFVSQTPYLVHHSSIAPHITGSRVLLEMQSLCVQLQ